MNRKQIEKHLKKVVTSYTRNLPRFVTGRGGFRDIVDNDIIVSGGCITSLLLNEPVNDYDLYFRTTDIALMVAQRCTTLAKRTDIDFKVNKQGNGLVSEALKYSYKSDQDPVEYTPVLMTKNAITLHGSIQLIVRFCGEPDELHKTFDFEHSKNYYSLRDGLVLRESSLEATINKELRYTGSGFPVNALNRAFKFQKRGWKLAQHEILKICYDISQLNFSDPETFAEQLGGMYGLMAADFVSEKNFNPSRESFFKFFDELGDDLKIGGMY